MSTDNSITPTRFRAYLLQLDVDTLRESILLRFRYHYLDNLIKPIISDIKSIFLYHYDQIKNVVPLKDDIRINALQEIRKFISLDIKENIYSDLVPIINYTFDEAQNLTFEDIREKTNNIPDENIDSYLDEYEKIDIAYYLNEKIKKQVFNVSIDAIFYFEKEIQEFYDEILSLLGNNIINDQVNDILNQMRNQLLSNAMTRYIDYVDDFLNNSILDEIRTEIFDALQLKIIYDRLK